MAEIDVWRAVRDHLARGGRCSLLAVADSRGSSPGKPGAVMAVGVDGPLAGTIGGGRVESTLVHECSLALAAGNPVPQRRVFRHRPDVPDSSGMICGGEQTVVMTMLSLQSLPEIDRLLADLAQGRSRSWELSPAGWRLSEEALSSYLSEGENWRYSHRAGASHEVWLVGGGHVSLALSRLLVWLDFRVIVVEERPHLPAFESNGFAHEKHGCAYESLATLIPEGPSVCVAIMTHSHDRDHAALDALFFHRVGYLGLLGSPAKVRALAGDRVRPPHFHAPMGLPIHSATPEEIAVSIAAELVAFRHGQTAFVHA